MANSAPAQVTQVLVADFFWPKPGKKNGTIKGSDETLYNAPPAILQTLQKGVTYAITWKPNHFGGVMYRMVESVQALQGPGPMQGQQAPAPQQYVPPQAAPPAAPQAYAYGKPAGSYTAISDKERAEQIFVCGALNNMLANPARDPFSMSGHELQGTVTMLRNVWANTFGGVQRNDELNDEIPQDFR